VVVHLWTDQEQRLSPGSALTTDRGLLHVVAARPHGHDRYIVQCEEVHDRNGAEALRGVSLRAEPVEVPGTLWVHQLVGAVVRDAHGTDLGTVAAVEANPASDLLVLESGALLPVRFVTSHDPEAGTVEVDIPEGLLEL
jgi:16S rRNA processing protein RimM